MGRFHRKSTPGVADGRVRRKNRWRPTRSYWNTPQDALVIDREKPGPGFRHVLRKREVAAFLDLLPERERLTLGLDAILLARGGGLDGWYRYNVIGICAWERGLWAEFPEGCFDEHRDLIERLQVPWSAKGDWIECRFTESTVRAYQLLHVLLHELGHHRDRMTTRYRRRSARGEGFAEDCAYRFEAELWDRYTREFGLP